MANFNIEVENKQKYDVLKRIYNYYTDFTNNPMVNEEESIILTQIIEEIFSEERITFNNFVVDFCRNKEIDYELLKQAYDEYLLGQTAVVDNSIWIGGKNK